MNLNEQINRLHADILTKDWSPDSGYPVGKRTIRYVTTAKMKRNIVPLIVRNGLTLRVITAGHDILPQVDGKASHVCVTVDFILANDDDYVRDRVIGEGTDVAGDKAFAIAMTYAWRSWVTNKFGVVDGMEDGIEADIVNTLQANAIPENTISEKPPVGDAAGAGKCTSDSGPTRMERQGADNAMRMLTERYEKGEIIEEAYNQAKEMYESIRTGHDVALFLRRKRELTS